MDKNYIFYRGSSKKSKEMEDFLKENNVNYTNIYLNKGENSKIVVPEAKFPYKEKDFQGLRSKISREEGFVLSK